MLISNVTLRTCLSNAAFSGGVKVELPMASCMNGIDPLHQKFNLKANVVAGVSINVIAIVGVWLNKNYITPQITQNDIETVRNPRHARHNKAIGTAKAIPIVLLCYLLCSGFMFILSRVKGMMSEVVNTSFLTLNKSFLGDNDGRFHAHQAVKQMYIWICCFPVHGFFVQAFCFALDKGAWQHLKNMIKFTFRMNNV